MEPFIACRLIPIDKTPGIRSIGVITLHSCNEEIREAAGGAHFKLVLGTVPARKQQFMQCGKYLKRNPQMRYCLSMQQMLSTA